MPHQYSLCLACASLLARVLDCSRMLLIALARVFSAERGSHVVQCFQVDVSDDASVTAAAATVKSVLGDGTLYGLGKSPHCPFPAPT